MIFLKTCHEVKISHLHAVSIVAVLQDMVWLALNVIILPA
jgi:hypothetical protein